MPQGTARVQLTSLAGELLDGYGFADSVPFTGDEISWQPVWRDGRSIGALAGQVVRLEVELFNERIHAIRGDLMPIHRVTQGQHPEPLYER